VVLLTRKQGIGRVILVSEEWHEKYPNAHLGILLMKDVCNPRKHAGLEERKKALEQELRRRYAGWSKSKLAQLAPMRAYTDYYKHFRKTYHVLLQLRSVGVEDKPLPSVAALVEAMFMAEVKNGLLTAGHDLEKMKPPITLDVARGDEHYVLLNGREQRLKQDDMIMRDSVGVICSVIYGLDRRTAIGRNTERVLFVVYAPRGIEVSSVQQHLEEIRDNVRFVAPDGKTEELTILG
jgi:DNA/RNA-binding domain of Phe-tRNA-synthetase-like protein